MGGNRKKKPGSFSVKKAAKKTLEENTFFFSFLFYLFLEAFKVNLYNLGQTVEKPRVQPGRTVPSEFPKAPPEGTPEGQFFQAA